VRIGRSRSDFQTNITFWRRQTQLTLSLHTQTIANSLTEGFTETKERPTTPSTETSIECRLGVIPVWFDDLLWGIERPADASVSGWLLQVSNLIGKRIADMAVRDAIIIVRFGR
jgi:hypothetical protein